MTLGIYSNQKINFCDPYVLRVQCPSLMLENLRIKRYVYKHIKGTWAISDVREESKMVNRKYITEECVYYAFSDEYDALQFILFCETKAQRVFMWPDVLFTIYAHT